MDYTNKKKAKQDRMNARMREQNARQSAALDLLLFAIE